VCGIEGAAADVLADLLCSLARHHSVFDPSVAQKRSGDGGGFEAGCSRAAVGPLAVMSGGGMSPLELAAIFRDPSWTKAVWFRDPLDRFLREWRYLH
jgi:hypothetical protein